MQWQLKIQYHNVSHLGINYTLLELIDETMTYLSKSNPEGISLYDFYLVIISKLSEEKIELLKDDYDVFIFICLDRYIGEFNVKLAGNRCEMIDDDYHTKWTHCQNCFNAFASSLQSENP